jgi:ABC-type lipoprotein release transport system permease subunit
VEAARLTVTGLALGLPVAFLSMRLASALLNGVSAGDPLTFTMVPVLLALFAVAASTIPARRASRVDAIVALRHE